jgi:hypothetical protein
MSLNDTTSHLSRKRNRVYTRQSIESRFWKYVQKTDSCWLWIGATRHFGYGVINSGGNNGKALTAHRVSWELHRGPIPPGMLVCHHCDNPRCVHPEHLFLGTYADNNHDMLSKGRNNRQPRVSGEKHFATKLTTEQVIQLRREYIEEPQPLAVFAAKYCTSLQTVWRIVHGKTWKHTQSPLAPDVRLTQGERNNQSKLTAKQVIAIRTEYASGNTKLQDIASRYGVSPQTIHAIVKRHTWRHI